MFANAFGSRKGRESGGGDNLYSAGILTTVLFHSPFSFCFLFSHSIIFRNHVCKTCSGDFVGLELRTWLPPMLKFLSSVFRGEIQMGGTESCLALVRNNFES